MLVMSLIIMTSTNAYGALFYILINLEGKGLGELMSILAEISSC